MRKYYCDICKTEIEPWDRHIEIDARIGPKFKRIDFHNDCYFEFMNELKRKTEKEE